MQIKTFTFNPFLENTYVLWTDSKKCIIIDPGSQTRREKQELLDFLSENQLSVLFVFNTHLHIDHIYGNDLLSEKYNAISVASEADQITRNPGIPKKREYFPFSDTEVHISKYTKEGDVFSLDEKEIHVLETPGHSDGSLSFYIPQAKSVFVGDVLEYGNFGSLKYKYASAEKMKHSVEKLFTLPDDTMIYFGHGKPCLLIEEKELLQKKIRIL